MTGRALFVTSTRAPLSQSVVKKLSELIDAGAFGETGRLPSEFALAKQLQVSRVTLREALWALEQDGLIVRQQGVGNFVQQQANKVRAGIERLESFTETIRRSGYTPRLEHLQVRFQPLSPAAAEAMACEPESPGVFVANRYYANESPVIYTAVEIPAHLFGPPDEYLATEGAASVREYMERRGVKAAFSQLSLAAVPAAEEVADYLMVPQGSPLLLLEGPSYTSEGQAVAWTQAYFDTSLYQFSLVRK